MRFFLDTEFAEDGTVIDLISIAVVAEDGREFYRVSTEWDWNRCNPWVLQNVLPHLPARCDNDSTWTDRATIAHELREFVDAVPDQSGEQNEFWAYYADYDWVALCQLFGTMKELPTGWPMYCHDIKQLAHSLGNPPLPEQIGIVHDALEDARWDKQAHEYLDGLRREPALRTACPRCGQPAWQPCIAFGSDNNRLELMRSVHLERMLCWYSDVQSRIV